MTLIESTGEWIECISLREGDTKNVSFMFLDRKHAVVESAVSGKLIRLQLTILCKNALGMTFKEEMQFWMRADLDKDRDKLRSYLKTLTTAKIDFADQPEEICISEKERK